MGYPEDEDFSEEYADLCKGSDCDIRVGLDTIEPALKG